MEMTNERFENVPQTEQLEGPSREEDGGRDAAWSQRSMYNAFQGILYEGWSWVKILGDQPITHTLGCNDREHDLLFTKRVRTRGMS